MKIAELIKSYELEIATARAEMTRILGDAQAEKRERLTVIESKRSDELTATIERITAKLAEARAIELDDAEYARQSQIRIPSGANDNRTSTVFHGISEEHTYDRANDPTGNGFLTDVGRAYFGHPEAQARLARHMHEMRVDRNGQMQERAAGLADTSDFPGLLVPQYLIDRTLGVPSNGRVLADHMTHVPLPDQGMEIDISVGNTPTTPAIQSSELTPVTGSEYDVTKKTIPVRTAESWIQVSRQSIERGRVIESVLVADMRDQMDAFIDNTVLNTATVGLSAVAYRTEYDDASPTGAELYPFLLKALSKTASVAKNKMGEVFMIAHPRRLYWLEAEMTTSWPLIAQPGVPAMASGVAGGVDYQNRVNLPNGTAIYGDYNVVTAALDGADVGGTEDVIYCVSKNQALLFEEANRSVMIRAEAPTAANLGCLYVLYSYFGFYFQQLANVHGRVDGTGTVAPAGF